jgi:hypothetical protein
MAPATRTVHRLRLRAPEEAIVRRTALAFEDALRVASLPDRAGCIVLVRRLALPPIRPNASPQSLALALEQAVERSRAKWVHGGSPAAPRAAVVWFADALDAHLEAARRLFADGALASWFWPLAIPDLRAVTEPCAALSRIALSLAARPEAPAAVPEWFRRLSAEGAAPRLREALTLRDVERLASAASIVPSRPKSRAWSNAPREETQGTPPRRSSADAPPRPLLPTGDAPVDALLRAVGAANGVKRRTTQRAEPRFLPSRRETPAPERISERDSAPSAPTGSPSRVGLSASHASGATHAASRRSLSGAERPATAPTSDPSNEGPEPSAVRARASSEGLSTPQVPDPLPGAWTSAGGLLFLLPVLGRLDYPEWVREHPGWAAVDVARHTLARLLTRLGLPAFDPAWALLQRQSPEREPVPWRFVAPAPWRVAERRAGTATEASSGRTAWITDASGGLLLAAWLGRRPFALTRAEPSRGARGSSGEGSPRAADRHRARRLRWHLGEARLEAVSQAWLIACRRWVRRHLAMGFRELVLRRAWLTTTSTHVDLALDLSTVDTRIRRAGLDLDPGWVDWFGRVVSFAYEPWAKRGTTHSGVGVADGRA